MTGSGNLEPLGGGYSLDVIRDEDGRWYGVLFDASGLDVWETCPLAEADEVRAAARAVMNKSGCVGLGLECPFDNGAEGAGR